MRETLARPASSTDPLTGIELMAHLYRRGGFGATRDELEAAVARGYEAVVDELLRPEDRPEIDEEVLLRYVPDSQLLQAGSVGQQIRFLYRMINTKRPLEEKMTLFWHCLFATSFNKAYIQHLGAQIDMFRRNCLGDFRTMLVDLSQDPAMIYWLDNQENTKDVHNENYGRELLELFSMGIGNYSEDDVKACARAFTGWTFDAPAALRVGTYGERPWYFVFRADQHDDTEKTFLGETGTFDGGDIIDIIVRQPATARFMATKLHGFFVSDEPDEEAIAQLADAYVRSGGNFREILRELFLSEHFRSRSAYFAKVKSPAEHVAGILRFLGGFERPAVGIAELGRAPGYMGQDLLNPPSVEGWHTGREWIDSGLLIERVNFSVAQMEDLARPGLRRVIERLREMGKLSAEQFVDACLDLLGPVKTTEPTRAKLVDFAAARGPLEWSADVAQTERRVGQMLQLISASREFQLG